MTAAASIARGAGATERAALIKKWREQAAELHALAEHSAKIDTRPGSIVSMVGRLVGSVGGMVGYTIEAARLERCADELEALESEARA